MGDGEVTRKVLIIDDFEEMAGILKEHLESSSFRVELATDGESGLAASRAFTPDIILLDIMLPRMDGYEVLRRLRNQAETAQTPVVVMTAYTSVSLDRDRREALQNGACAFLRKPFGLDDLVSTLRRHCR